MNLPSALQRKQIDLPALKRQIAHWKLRGDKIVFTNGCFDVFHPGHLYILQEASHLGQRLIVGLNSDASVKRLKGDKRPVFNEWQRAELLCSLEMVDALILFGEDTPATLIELVLPDVLVKGGDYKVEDIAGADRVIARGGEVVIVPLLSGYSSSGLIVSW